MRELDDAALERRLRVVLRERLGGLPLDLTVAELDRRRESRDTARRRRRALIVLGLAAALLLPIGVLVGGPRPLSDVVVAPVPSASPESSRAPAASATPNPSPAIVDPHALLVVTGKVATTPPWCVNVDRMGTRDGSSRRVVACADSLKVTRDGTSAALAGPRGMSIVDLRDGHELETIETGQYTFPTAWSPSGRWLMWSSCQKSRSESHSCSVHLSARDGDGQHELYRGDDGRGAIWLPDESRVAVPAPGSVLVGAADGSDLRPLAAGGPESGWATDDDGRLDWAPGGLGYLYLVSQIPADCNGQSVRGCQPVLADVMYQGLSGGANDGPPVNLTNLEPGQFAVAAAWSPDGRTLALLVKAIDPATDPYQFQGTLLGTPADLLLRDASGTIQRIEGVALPESQDEFVVASERIHWSPDGTHLAIEAGNGRTGGAASIDTVVVALDGSAQVVLRDARSVAWSPDGTELAFVHRTGPTDLGDDAKAPSLPIEVAGPDGSVRRQVTVATGDPDSLEVLWATH